MTGVGHSLDQREQGVSRRIGEYPTRKEIAAGALPHAWGATMTGEASRRRRIPACGDRRSSMQGGRLGPRKTRRRGTDAYQRAGIADQDQAIRGLGATTHSMTMRGASERSIAQIITGEP